MNIATLHLCLPIVIAITIATSIAPASAELLNLTDRNSPRPQTTNGVPHVQIGVDPVPEISSELLRRVSNIPGVEIGDSVVSLRGSIGFWVSEDIKIARPEVIVAGREFAHLHPDGSLHASLSPKLANEAVVTGWSIYHPWADQRPGWEGFVMIYTPQTDAELDVVFGLVEAFFKTIKAELIWRHPWHTRRAAELAIFEYINGFYNPRRKHSALGWKSPLAFERMAA